MNEKAAKDFLVQQAAEQASLEGISLSDLEKRMMYFTESGYCPENPIQLNEEFEAKYATPEYEEKLARLLRDAHERLKKETAESLRPWNDAISCLRKGDHYIMIFADARSGGTSPNLPSWTVWVVAVLTVVLFSVLFYVFGLKNP
jgi:hypothetical protein